jgi:hypothetical protein
VARVELRDAWYVSGDADALRKELLRFFRRQKMKVVFEEEGAFHSVRVAQGSQFWTRLLGGWFVSPTTLPKQALVTFSESSKGLHLRVTIEETMGLGLMDSILAKKYEKFFEQWMDDLEAALDVAGPAPVKSEEGIREKPPKKKP